MLVFDIYKHSTGSPTMKGRPTAYKPSRTDRILRLIIWCPPCIVTPPAKFYIVTIFKGFYFTCTLEYIVSMP